MRERKSVTEGMDASICYALCTKQTDLKGIHDAYAGMGNWRLGIKDLRLGMVEVVGKAARTPARCCSSLSRFFA
jgi:hypothetical protein